MTQIEGSHVALVAAGRAGADVMVGDSLPQTFLRRNTMSGTQTSNELLDPAELDPSDDVETQVCSFLRGRISDDAEGTAPPGIAQDDDRRGARLREARARAARQPAYLKMFPNANRLRGY
jgi:hypothetical protein